jgi:hypothetical protein
MRSRLLIGASGWLLGAVAATCGSMLAVSNLAHGLLGPSSQQLSVADVRSDLASAHRAAATPTASAVQSRPRPAVRPSRSAADAPSPAPDGTLLVSKAGSVMASCQSGLAYLQYWSPAQGYQADDVIRGPAARARLEFEGVASTVVMTVSCAGGVPTDQVSTGGDDGGHHDE